MVIYHSKNPRALKNYATSTLPLLCKWSNKAWISAPLFPAWLTEYFKFTVEIHSEKKIPFKILLLLDNTCGLPRALMETYNEITVVFIFASTTSILQPKGQGVISILKSYSLTYTLCKALHHRCSFLMDLGKSIENLLERTHHSRCRWGRLWFTGRNQNISINGSLKEVDSNLHGWLLGIHDLGGGSNCRCGRIRSGAWRCDWIDAISW